MIAVDIDGTIAATTELLNKRFRVPLSEYPSPLPEGFWESEAGMEVYRDVKPLPYAAEALKLVDELAYMTVRPKKADFITVRWLQKHGFPEGPVYFCRDLNEKAALVAQLGAVIAFDDDPKAPEAFAKYVIPLVLIFRPYNASVVAARTNWKNILEEGRICTGRLI